MHAVFKWEIPILDSFYISLPLGARCLKADVQHETPCLWALVDTGAETSHRHFRLAGTGHPIGGTEKLEYVDTFFLQGGALVLHLFEEMP